MDERDWLADRFEAQRDHLRGVAYRMLGSLSEADDAVQEAWLHASRAGAGGVDNLGGWLTTVVARVCLDMLRARKARREDPLPPEAPDAAATPASPAPPSRRAARADPEQETLLAESVGLALLVVLDTLAPPERLAFVLHDLFGLSFEEIASIVGRTPDAARQLASRARRRVQGAPTVPGEELTRQRAVVGAFLAALRARDLDALLAVLDPDLVFAADAAAGPPAGHEIHGALAWAKQALSYRGVSGFTQAALVDGAVGAVLAPRGRLQRVLVFTFAGAKIARVDVIADRARLRTMELSVLEG